MSERVGEPLGPQDFEFKIGTSPEDFFASMEMFIPDPAERAEKYKQILQEIGIYDAFKSPTTSAEETLSTVIRHGHLNGRTILIEATNKDITNLSDEAIRKGLGLDNKEGEA